MRRVRAARKFLEKFDPQYQQLEEEAERRERTVELQEQAEVFAQVSFLSKWGDQEGVHPKSLRGVWAVPIGGAFCELLLAVEYPTASKGAAQAWYLTLHANNLLNVFLPLGVLIKVFFLELWLVYLVVSRPHQLFGVLAELLESVCVELEGSGVHPVRLTMPRGYLAGSQVAWRSALFSSVGCIRTF